MNAPSLKGDALTAKALRELNGRIVFVKSTRDRRNPPTGMRGWMEVVEKTDAAPGITIAIPFPQMFSTPAHLRSIPLDDAAIERLLASEYNGTFEFTIDDELA